MYILNLSKTIKKGQSMKSKTLSLKSIIKNWKQKHEISKNIENNY